MLPIKINIHRTALIGIITLSLSVASCGKTCTEFSGTYIQHDVSALPRTGTYQLEDCPSCQNPFNLYEVTVLDDSTIVQTVISRDGDTTVTKMKLISTKENTLYEKTY